MQDTYVVLIPEAKQNPTDAYLVVPVSEWVEVTLGEKDTYTFANEHEDYPSAATDRDYLNSKEPAAA